MAKLQTYSSKFAILDDSDQEDEHPRTRKQAAQPRNRTSTHTPRNYTHQSHTTTRNPTRNPTHKSNITPPLQDTVFEHLTHNPHIIRSWKQKKSIWLLPPDDEPFSTHAFLFHSP